jgi:hypothetical protein
MANSAATGTATLAEVDPTRTLVFSGGQSVNGQGSGEGNYTTDDILGTATGRHQLTSPSQLEVKRSSPQGAASWTSYALQLLP